MIGCALIDVAGANPVTIGEIENVDRTAGPVALLVVNGAAGEVLIPFAVSYLRKIDLAARRVEMALREGLIDLSLPEKIFPRISQATNHFQSRQKSNLFRNRRAPVVRLGRCAANLLDKKRHLFLDQLRSGQYECSGCCLWR